MATITKSRIVSIEPQPDGRKWVSEEHDLEDGRVHKVRYLADSKTDPEQLMLDRAPLFEEAITIADEKAKVRADFKAAMVKVQEVLIVEPEVTLKEQFALSDDEALAVKKHLKHELLMRGLPTK